MVYTMYLCLASKGFTDYSRKINNIGITHVFSCINICRVLFEHEADRLSVQHHLRDQSSVICNETNMCDHYSCIFTLLQPNSH